MMKYTQEMLNEAQANYDLAAKELMSVKTNFATQECPLNIGDVVEVCGYSHAGKKMRVDSIRIPRYSMGGKWEVFGTVLKKDGSNSLNYADFDQRHYENYLKAKS